MLLLSPDAFEARKAIARGPLAPLADSLAAELSPLIGSELFIPREKALLSRDAGRCTNDSATLIFDPYSPRVHRCPICGTEYTDDLHHRAWIYPYQLWLAERSVHAALLYALRGDERHATLAENILRQYAAIYLEYPNRDNVLGPTRLFFSTYLESIWLLQICIAADLMETAGRKAVADVVREQIARPSAAVIAQYDEGMSNRQVWNNAAMMAASLLLGDRSTAERLVHSTSGIEAHLANGLLSDGTWYEGENYHLFAHRGLWYGITMAEVHGMSIAPDLLARFRDGFSTPFATALPDLTLPSRKDSQYAISLRQSRFAELCELGLGRGDDARLVGALARLYAGDIPRGDTGRSRSSADVERNMPPSALTRADLGWRSLLHARAELPELAHTSMHSAHLDAQGVTVFRRDAGELYVALDWGQSGGGHGHPDRLNVTFAHRNTRVLDDLGTGSYVDPSLHWYRSTLAHNAPLINGHSQASVAGTLLAHDERGGVGWILAQVDGIAPGVRVQRAIIVTPDYFVDEVSWTADRAVRFELPVHFDGDAGALAFTARALDGGGDLEDGFNFVGDSRAAEVPSMNTIALSSESVRAWITADRDAVLFRATGPGQPSTTTRPFYVIRCEGGQGTIRSVWAWSKRVGAVTFPGDTVHITMGDEQHVHRRTDAYWQVDMRAGAAKSGIELYGWRKSHHAASTVDASTEAPRLALTRNGAHAAFELGKAHYRRSEDNWEDAGHPTATVSLSATSDELVVDVRVATPSPVFVSAEAINRHDNEHADINGHGVQLYVRTGTGSGAWMLIPESETQHVRVRPISGWGSLAGVHAAWTRTAEGFDLRAHIPLTDTRVDVDVIVNETAPGRERRRGQLVLSGAGGEFVYLRGDRHDPRRLIPLAIQD